MFVRRRLTGCETGCARIAQQAMRANFALIACCARMTAGTTWLFNVRLLAFSRSPRNTLGSMLPGSGFTSVDHGLRWASIQSITSGLL